jgi:hypothetical protein
MLCQAPDGGLMAISAWPLWSTSLWPWVPRGARMPARPHGSDQVRPQVTTACSSSLTSLSPLALCSYLPLSLSPTWRRAAVALP